MANIKKVLLKELVERLEKVERMVVEIVKDRLESPVVAIPADSPVMPSTKAVSELVKAIVSVSSEVKHKCQTNTCESMETKEYQGKDRKMWLCESHKF